MQAGNSCVDFLQKARLPFGKQPPASVFPSSHVESRRVVSPQAGRRAELRRRVEATFSPGKVFADGGIRVCGCVCVFVGVCGLKAGFV